MFAVGVLALGGMVSGAFIAGLIVNGGSDDEGTPSVHTLPAPESSGTDENISDELIRQIEAAFQGAGDIKIHTTLGAEDVGGVAGTSRDKGFAGTVQQVQDGRITINTPYGPLEAAIGPETLIQRTEVSIVTADELSEGLEVQIVGQPNEVGFLEATEISVLPQ